MVALIVDDALLHIALILGQIHPLIPDIAAGLVDLEIGLGIQNAHNVFTQHILPALEIDDLAGRRVDLLDLHLLV